MKKFREEFWGIEFNKGVTPIGKDFYLVWFLRERSRGDHLLLDMRRFFVVIDDLDLWDLLLQRLFTWNGG